MSSENKKGIDLQGKEAYLTSLTLIRKNTVIGYFDIFFFLGSRINDSIHILQSSILIYISHIVITTTNNTYD
ncbi:MAG TPA: hypothetical protein VKA95_10610 [Nitrososphaeraceae archaeon]|jgi:hypothetical protein|nr:hypothetical protein [Nitrososphaeraceae archaeon]